MHTALQISPDHLDESSPFAHVQDLSQLGQMLREVRVSHGHDLNQIATELHLKPAFLEALESGSWHKLPGDTYGRGYLRQYAEYLGLSAEEAAICCQRIQGKVDSKLHYLNIASTQETPSRGMIWLSALALVILLLGWGWYHESSILKAPEALLAQAPEMTTDTTVISAAPVKQNVETLCLNIPSHETLPCFAKQAPPPSLLLTAASPYPIWETSWQNTQ